MGVIKWRAPQIETFNENSKAVDRLLRIHSDVVGAGPGRKHDVDVLHKSAIVLLCACWEAFVEDLAATAVRELVERLDDAQQVPTRLQASICIQLSASKDDRKPWSLAGDGWKEELKRNCSDHIEGFHSPGAAKVDQFLEGTLGLRDVSHAWRWPSVSAATAKDRLGKLVRLRGTIAHRVSPVTAVGKKRVENAVDLVHRLAVLTHNRVNRYIQELTGTPAWAWYRHKSSGAELFKIPRKSRKPAGTK